MFDELQNLCLEVQLLMYEAVSWLKRDTPPEGLLHAAHRPEQETGVSCKCF